MFPISISKLRLAIFVAFCLVVWKTFHYFSQLNSLQLINLVNSNFETSDSVSDKKALPNPVFVTVYYEALCSDSRNFILKQLVPAFEKAPNLIEVDFVPYGKATTIKKDDSYVFECQHSYIECEANKIHACVLSQPFPKDIHIKYVACMIKDNVIPHEAGQRCAEDIGVDYAPIRDCANGIEGSKLLKEYGDRTHAVNPKITFIPTVHLNQSSKVPLVYLLKDLFKEICNMYEDKIPRECL